MALGTDNRNREIAETLRALGITKVSLWSASYYRCSRGHRNMSAMGSREPYRCTVTKTRSLGGRRWFTVQCRRPVVRELQPRDFTKAEYLLPAIKAWIRSQPEDEGWNYQIAWGDGQALGWIGDKDWVRHYEGSDPHDEWIALRHAFAAALGVGE